MDFDSDMSLLLELPYRCPRCGESRRFPSLSALKSHLEYEHTYSTDPPSPKLAFSPPKPYKSAFRPWEHFSAEAKELERQLELAKEAEKRHKRERELSPSNLINSRQKKYDDVMSPSRDGYYKSEREPRKDNYRSEREPREDYYRTEREPRNDNYRNEREPQKDYYRTEREPRKDNYRTEREPCEDYHRHEQEPRKDNYRTEPESRDDYYKSEREPQRVRTNSPKIENKHLDVIEKLKDELKEKEKQLEKANEDLQKLLTEKRKLQKDNLELNKQLDTHIQYIADLKQQLQEKDKLMQEKERASNVMNNFLKATAQKEANAKEQVKHYIDNLTQRAEQAENEVKKYHSLGSRSNSVNRVFPHDLHGSMPNIGSHPSLIARPQSAPNPELYHPGSNGSSLNNWDAKVTPGQYPIPRPGLHSPGNDYSSFNGGTVPEEPMELEDPSGNNGLHARQTGMSPLMNGYRNTQFTDDGDDMGIESLEAAYNEIARKKAERIKDQKQQFIQKEMERLQKMNSLDEEEITDTITTVTDEDDDDSDVDYDASQGELPKDLVARKEDPESERRKRYREALFQIFSYLDTRTLLKIASVNKDWMEVSRHPALWKKVKLTNHRISSNFLQNLSKWCTELQYLSLECLKGRKIKARETTGDYMDKLRGCLEPGLEFLLKASAETLTTLRITDCSNIVTDRALWLASCHCRNLQNIMYISETDPIGHEVIWALGAGCRNIVSLQVPPMHPCQKPHKFNNRCMQMIGRCWPLLRALGVGGIDVDVKGLVSVAKNCSRLQLLEVDHMFEVTEEVALAMCENGLRDLETLIFTATPVTPKALLQFHNSCPSLAAININVGISDYFADPKKQENIDEYNRIIAKLKSLKKRPGISDILHLRSDFG